MGAIISIFQNKAVLVLLLLVTLAAAGLAYEFPPLQYLEHFIDPQLLGSWVQQNGGNGIAMFIVLGAVSASLGLPRQLVALIAGYSFGLWQGMLLALTSVSLGALLTFWFARFVARPWVRRRFPEAVAKAEHFTAQQAFLKLLTIRFLPLGTNMATNLAAGTTRLPAQVFFAATLLGFVPQTAIFVLGGNGFNIDSGGQLVLGAGLLMVSCLLSLIIYRRHRRRPSSGAPG